MAFGRRAREGGQEREGELWGDAGRTVRDLANDPRVAGRVELHPGYVPADRIAGLLAQHDVMALTYRTATASQNVLLAHKHGLPVLATTVGTFPEQIRDGVDGLLVPRGDRGALVEALRRLAEPGVTEALRSAVRPPDLSGPWANYADGLLKAGDRALYQAKRLGRNRVAEASTEAAIDPARTADGLSAA